jgi:hypothetical protein
MEKDYNRSLSLGERVAEGRVRGYGRLLELLQIPNRTTVKPTTTITGSIFCGWCNITEALAN